MFMMSACSCQYFRERSMARCNKQRHLMCHVALMYNGLHIRKPSFPVPATACCSLCSSREWQLRRIAQWPRNTPFVSRGKNKIAHISRWAYISKLSCSEAMESERNCNTVKAFYHCLMHVSYSGPPALKQARRTYAAVEGAVHKI